MQLQASQFIVFLVITGLIGALTWWKCRGARHAPDGHKEYFLAGGGLTWVFVAGSITLTNLSTDQLVGMNGSQMALLAWWELSAVVGLCILALVFIPVYYKYNCTTTTELLEKRYGDKHIRAIISALFLFGNLFIFLPTVLYTGSLFMMEMFALNPDVGGEGMTLYLIAAAFAVVGACYAIFGGLRAVAVSDTYSGVLLLGMALLVTFLALKTIGFDFEGIPKERLTMIGVSDSPIPFATLFTGMIFIQMFYWSTNQTITQRAMASPSTREIVPPIIVLPGIVAYKLYGDIGDKAYGRIVQDLLPGGTAGILAAAITAAVLTTFNSILNSSAALYVCDIHEVYINKKPNVKRLSMFVTIAMVIVGVIMVQVYNNPDASIIDTIQKLYGLLSMPILSTFIVGLLFKNVDAKAMMIALLLGIAFYWWALNPLADNAGIPTQPIKLHFIHLMAFTLIGTVSSALLLSTLIFRKTPKWDAHTVFSKSIPASSA